MECLWAGPGWCVFLLTAPILCLYGWVALWESIMHPFQRLKIMCTLAAEALYKQGNMSLIKISFISLFIKRLSLIIEFSAPPPWALRFIFVLSVLSVTPLWLWKKKIYLILSFSTNQIKLSASQIERSVFDLCYRIIITLWINCLQILLLFCAIHMCRFICVFHCPAA